MGFPLKFTKDFLEKKIIEEFPLKWIDKKKKKEREKERKKEIKKEREK